MGRNWEARWDLDYRIQLSKKPYELNISEIQTAWMKRNGGLKLSNFLKSCC